MICAVNGNIEQIKFVNFSKVDKFTSQIKSTFLTQYWYYIGLYKYL